jgi:hypothetical protein
MTVMCNYNFLDQLEKAISSEVGGCIPIPFKLAGNEIMTASVPAIMLKNATEGMHQARLYGLVFVDVAGAEDKNVTAWAMLFEKISDNQFILPCVVYAEWADSIISLSSPRSSTGLSFIQSNGFNGQLSLDNFRLETFNLPVLPLRRVRVGASWANSMDPWDPLTNSSALDVLMNRDRLPI